MKIPSRHHVEFRQWLQRHSMRLRVIGFAGLFFGLQWGWAELRDTPLEHALVDSATVKPAAALVNWLTPDVHAMAIGSALRAPGGGLNILNGCEGMELMFMLAAAFLVAPLAWQQRLTAFLLGILLAYAVNQARILVLFYAWRADRQLFDSLHGMVMPIVAILIIGAYFHLVLHVYQHGRSTSSHRA